MYSVRRRKEGSYEVWKFRRAVSKKITLRGSEGTNTEEDFKDVRQITSRVRKSEKGLREGKRRPRENECDEDMINEGKRGKWYSRRGK